MPFCRRNEMLKRKAFTDTIEIIKTQSRIISENLYTNQIYRWKAHLFQRTRNLKSKT